MLAISVHGSNLKHYIVYMGEHSLLGTNAVINSNHEMLSSYVDSVEEAQKAVVHHFTKTFRGFSAMLTPEQADVISKNNKVVSVFESSIHHLQTTRSWDFMQDRTHGLAKGLFYQLRKDTSHDVIVGHFDSGVWPEAQSFQANGLGPVPKQFKGECVPGQDFGNSACNGKIIGARYYYQGFVQDNGPPEATGAVYYSARDDFGHGSHTASIAVEAEMNNVNLPGVGNYTAKGGAPGARLAVYKRNTLKYSVIKGKIVICIMKGDDDSSDKAEVLKEGAAAGMIVLGQGPNANMLSNYAVPTSIMDAVRGKKLFAYLKRTKKPSGKIQHNKVVINTKPAPKMAEFSSKGPSALSPDIIKPDITAPGVNILAAWPVNLREEAVDVLNYRFDSGTSMACPHATGVAAILKSGRRKWSPAAIKSALMTTAIVEDNTGGLIKSGEYQATPFDLGSGHLSPDLALDPGLVYDFDTDDIISFLCFQGAKNWQLQNLIGKPVTCKDPPVPTYNLNYPSIGISYLDRPISVYRTVTFKGKQNDPKTFEVSIENPPGVNLKVVPNLIDFSDGKTNATYRVDFEPNGAAGYVFGSITWSDGKEHNVRSPIAVNVI
ncbi:Subtilisin-like protease [Quillaja saponaria]|uniref:Subtilisin-like protease n=1 Tax=Quillaja saponaria TaxID=32244 RepID=A0AAD7VHQ3_QUISA|nr:Subtilisin-like protease [Quillaja saponaria]